MTPRGGREGGRARVGREAGPRGSEGERHRPEPPPPHRDAHTGSTQRPGAHLGTPAASPDARLPRGRRGRTGPRADAPSANRPHGPAWATATKASFSSTPRGASFPPHTPPRDQARRAAAAAAAGTPFKPQLPPARRAALPPRHPATAPGPVRARLPPREEGPGSTAAGRPDEERERKERRRAGRGSEPAERGPSTAGRAAAAPPAGDASQGTGRPLGRRPGTRAKPAGITLHPTRSSPATPAAPSRPETNGQPPGARGDASRREREPRQTPTPTDEDPRVAAGPNVRRRAGRGRPPVPPNKKSAPESEANPAVHGPSRAPRRGKGG